jgi:hypothetical protein
MGKLIGDLGVALGLVCLLFLSGCSALLTQSAGASAGVGGAAIGNAITSNGAVTAGIGLGAQAAAIAGVQYAEKRVHGAEQNAIASAAGTLAPGQIAPWSIRHDIPIEANEHGELTVVQEYKTAAQNASERAFDCKLVVFSVLRKEAGRPQSSFYTTYVCAADGGWQWATAEPATGRWGSLQ